MSFLFYTLVAILTFLVVLPVALVYGLRLILRRNQFSAGVAGPLTFTNLMLRVPIKMNLQVIVRIDTLQLKLSLPSKLADFGALG